MSPLNYSPLKSLDICTVQTTRIVCWHLQFITNSLCLLKSWKVTSNDNNCLRKTTNRLSVLWVSERTFIILCTSLISNISLSFCKQCLHQKRAEWMVVLLGLQTITSVHYLRPQVGEQLVHFNRVHMHRQQRPRQRRIYSQRKKWALKYPARALIVLLDTYPSSKK